MELRRLQYFIVLAEELHFRRAAARLAISQPPLSIAIKQLEEEIGAPLFERTTKLVSLTPVGAAFYPEALRIVAQLDRARSIAQRVASGERGVLRLGFVGGMLLRRMPELLALHRRAHPEASVILRELSSSEQIRSIRSGELAAGFLHMGGLVEELDHLLMADEDFVACLPSSHPLAGAEIVKVNVLRDEQFVMFSRDISPGYFDTVISICAREGFSPTISFEVGHWLTAVLLVAKGLGVALVPRCFANTGLRGVSFVELKAARTHSLAHFAWKRTSSDPLLLRFVDLVRTTLSSRA